MLRMSYNPQQLTRLDELIETTGLKMDDQLQAIDQLLDDETILQRVRQQVAQRYPKTTQTGRPGTPVVCIFRMLVLKHLYQWSFEETEQFVRDSLTLRKFARLGLEPVPDDTTLIRWSALLSDEVLHQINDRLVELARQKRVSRGRKLRVDTTCVETNIHYPTDSSLLADGVRRLSGLKKKSKRRP